MGRKLEDLTGNQYGELTVLRLFSKAANTPTQWTCRCNCGNETNVQSARLKSGKTRSCGHMRVIHGQHNSPAYKSWNMMKDRCLNPESPNYEKYGAAGITICDEWLSFDNFHYDMGDRPEGMTLNRILGAMVYSKQTCEWSTLSIQSYDQRLDPRNTSGVKGVRWRDERFVWQSSITQDKVVYNLYYGVDFFEAVCKRKSAELKFYGFGR